MTAHRRGTADTADTADTGVILAGGRARRLGEIDKPGLTVGGASLLAHAFRAAASAGCIEVIVVGPPTLDLPAAGVPARVVREHPPFGGPAAALIAALPWVTTEWMLLLAADVPLAPAAVALLTATPPSAAADGIRLRDAAGRPQHLVARYRTVALQQAAARLADAHGAPLRALVDGLRIEEIDDPSGLSRDVDTWEDVWGARAEGARMSDDETPLPPEALDGWAAAVADRLGLDRADLPIALVLDLARDVAHGVARPAAPLSAFAAGLAAGRAGGESADVEAAVRAVTELALHWRRA